MRKVGERLGTSAMALYTYVPAKTELIDLMLDTVLGELPTSYPSSGGGGPRPRRALPRRGSCTNGIPGCCRSRWLARCSARTSSTSYEAQLQIFDGLGLRGVEVTRLVGAVASYVRGSAKALADAREAERATGVNDDDWWLERSALLEEMGQLDWESQYPVTSKLAADHAFDQADRTEGDASSYMERDALDTFAFGLDVVLDGVEAFVARRGSASSRASGTRRRGGS